MANSSKISVEILRTVAWVGKQGEVKEVSLSYAQNKLFPEKIARPHTASSTWTERKNSIHEKRFSIVERLHEKTLEITLPHSSGHLSETVDEAWIVSKIRDKFHITLLPEMIRMGVKHIKKAGKHTIHIDLSTDAYAQIIFFIR